MLSSALKQFSSNITGNYTLSTQASACGPWKVFDGKNKKTGKAVSVFVFDRKSLEPSSGSLLGRSTGAIQRKVQDEVVERLRKEASALARLRHPNVLELAEPVEETRNGLMFATEPIASTLAGLLRKTQQGNGDHRARGTTSDGQTTASASTTSELDELDIQKGLHQVAKGLQFLHESAGLVHGNLTPDAIYINMKLDWKVSGMAFAGPPDGPATKANLTMSPMALSEVLYYEPRLPRSVQLDLDYTSPDFVLDSKISPATDMFSLGLIIITIYNRPAESPLRTAGNVTTYKKLFSASNSIPSRSNRYLCNQPLPEALSRDVLPRLITRTPATRLSARTFQESQFFDNVLVSTLRFLETLPAKSSHEKSQFMRGLPRILNQFPKGVLAKKLLPGLLEECKDIDLLPLILGNIFKIASLSDAIERIVPDKVVPKLREIFLSTNAKGLSEDRDARKDASLLIVLDNMVLIAEHCPVTRFRDDMLPLVELGLGSSTHAVTDKALGCLPKVLPKLDFSTIKNDLFPVVAMVFSKTSSLAIKIRALEAFVVLCGGERLLSKANGSPILDKYTIQEKIVPLLKGIKTKEPAVMMAALAVFEKVGEVADSEFLALDVLPVLWSFSLGPLLNLTQFQDYMKLISSLSSKIEHQQMRKLQELSTHPSRGSGTVGLETNQDDLLGSTNMGGSSEFESLVLGRTAMAPSPKSLPSLPQQFAGQSHNPSLASWNTVTKLPAASRTSPAVTPDQSSSSAIPQFLSTVLSTSSSWAVAPASAMSTHTSLPPSLSTNTPMMARLNSVQPNPNTWNAFQPMQPVTAASNGMGRMSQLQSTSTQKMNAPPSNSNPKSGLDAYESLI